MLTTRAESERDQRENAFTAILRRLFHDVPAATAAVFVDLEGECIDYVCAIDPFEAKVAAAHMHMHLEQLRHTRASSATGDVFGFELIADEREVWVRRLADEYAIVVVLAPGFDRVRLCDAIARAGDAFRQEVGLEAPPWESQLRLSVRVRASTRWTYAPVEIWLRGERHTIASVLGRWTEPGPDEPHPPRVCFRVRTRQGEELTLAHDERARVWLML